MPKLEIHGLSDMLASTHHKVKLHATDDLRGQCEITLTDPRDVQILADFLNKTLAGWRRGDLASAGLSLAEDVAA